MQKQGDTWDEYKDKVAAWSRAFEEAFNDEHENRMLRAKTSFDYLSDSVGLSKAEIKLLINELGNLDKAFNSAMSSLNSFAVNLKREAELAVATIGKTSLEIGAITQYHKYKDAIEDNVEALKKLGYTEKEARMSIDEQSSSMLQNIGTINKSRIAQDNWTQSQKDAKKSLKDSGKAAIEYSKYIDDLNSHFNQLSKIGNDIIFDIQVEGIDDITSSFFEVNKKVNDLYKNIEELDQEFKDFISDSVEEGTIGQKEYNSQLAAWGEAVDSVKDKIPELSKRMLEVANAQAEIKISETALEYSELIGSIEEQIVAEQNLINSKLKFLEIQKKARDLALQEAYANLKLAEAQYEAGKITEQTLDLIKAKYEILNNSSIYAEENAAIEKNILLYQKQYQELRKTGSILDGLSYGFQKIGRTMETSFDIGVQLAEDLYDTLGEVFESVIKGERTVREAFEDMADAILAAIAKIAIQKIIIPVIFEMSGLSGLLGMGGGSGSAATTAAVSSLSNYGMPNNTAATSSVTNQLGLSAFGSTLSKWLDTEIFSWGGGANPLLSGGALTIGNLLGLLGGAYSIGTGITGLISGDLIGGGAGLLGGSMMGISSIASIMGVATSLTAALGPIGIAVSLLGSIFSGFLQDEPRIEMDIGPEGWSIGGDMEDDVKAETEKAIKNYFDSLEEAFKIDIGDILRDNPDLATNWTIKGEGEIGDITNLAGRWLDDFWRQYSSAIAEAVFGGGMPFNVEFFEGLGLSWYGMEEGELGEQITAITGYLYALQEGGMDVNQAINDLKFTFFEAGGDPFGDLGDFFQNLQRDGEEIGATMARVLTTLDIIPDGLQRMADLVSGIDRSVVESWSGILDTKFGAEGADWIIETVVDDLAAGMSKENIIAEMEAAGVNAAGTSVVAAFIRAMAAGMSEGMSEEEAYQTLENQLAFASELLMPAIDTALASAIENDFDLSTFEDAFVESMEASLVSALTQVAMHKIFEELLVSTFDQFASLSDLIGQYVSGDITATDLTAGFTGIMDQLGPALEAISPIIQELFGVIQTFVTGTTIEDVSTYADWLDQVNSAFDPTDIAAYVAQYEDLVKWRDNEIAALDELGVTAEEAAAGVARVGEIFNQQVAEMLSDITAGWEIEAPNEYQQAIDDLNDKFANTMSTLNALADAGIDVSGAVDQVTQSYQQQYATIKSELLQAIRDIEYAMMEWSYSIQSDINDMTSDLTGSAQAAWDIARAAQENYTTAMSEGNYDLAVEWVNNMKSAYDQTYSAGVAEITARYNTLIDAAQEAADAQRDAIESSYEAQIDAVNAQIDALDELRDQVQETYQTQIDALQEQLSVAEAFASVVESVHDQIMDMLTGTENPADVFERLAIAASEVQRLQSIWASASGEDKAQYAQDYADALQTYLSLAGEAYQAPSSEYQTIFNSVLDQLQDIELDAQTRSASLEDLTQRIADLNEQMESELASIDDQQEALRNQIESLQDAEQTALDSIDTNVEGLQDAMEAELSAWGQQMAGHYETLEQLGLDAYTAQQKELEAILQGMSQDEAMLTWTSSMATSLTEQNRIGYELYGMAVESNRIGYELYNMLANINSSIASVSGYASGAAVFTRPTLAVVGEGREDEYLFTESQLGGILSGGNGSRGDGSSYVNFEIAQGAIQVSGVSNEADGERIGKAVFRGMLRESLKYDSEARRLVARAAKSSSV